MKRMMQRILFFLLCLMLTSGTAASGMALANDDDTLATESELQLDFSVLSLDNPLATPVAVDPIDKPTPTPAPTPSYWYDTYTNSQMGISFSVPGTWLFNPNTNADTTIQFVEPQDEMMEQDGYQTRLTIEKVNTGLTQSASDARSQLESVLETFSEQFTEFKAGEIASATIDDARGYYCYYRATYNDGTKEYSMRGRIMVVAKDKALYQIRITTPSAWYSYYEYVYRKVRSTFKFL